MDTNTVISFADCLYVMPNFLSHGHGQEGNKVYKMYVEMFVYTCFIIWIINNCFLTLGFILSLKIYRNKSLMARERESNPRAFPNKVDICKRISH